MGRKLRWPNTIRAQLFVGFGAILLVSFTSSAIGYVSLYWLRTSGNEALGNAAQVRELSLELQTNFLRARQAEDDYISNWQSAATDGHADALIQANQESLNQACANLEALKALEGSQSDLAQELTLLESLFANYESAYTLTVERIRAVHQDEDLTSQIQEMVEAIPDTVNAPTQTELRTVLWRLMAKEQMYFNTQNQQDLFAVRAELDRLAFLLESTQSEPVSRSFANLAQTYLEQLNSALLLQQQVQINTIVADNINREIDQIIQAIETTSSARATAARANLNATARRSTIALLTTTLTALGLCLWASFWLGRRIMAPITALQQAAEHIGAGHLDYRLQMPNDNEFSVVAATFNQMVHQLRHILIELEDRVARRTRALAESNQSLQEKTRSLESAMQQLRASETNYRTLIEHLQAGVVVHNRDTTIRMCNQMASRLLNTDAEELIGQPANHSTWPLVDEFGNLLTTEQYPVNQVIATGTPLHNYLIGIETAEPDGPIWVLVNAFPLFDSHQTLQEVIVTFTDITERKLAEEKLRHRALHDALTGLPNRTLLVERLEHAIQSVQRHPDTSFAVLFIDLNRFKIINDSLGHAIGDQILIQVTEVLLRHVRVSDTVARLGGDEFVILLEQLHTPREAIHVVERIQADLKQPIQLMGRTMFTSASIGIAFSHHQYKRGQDILRDADNAMYRAKASGQMGYEIFNPAMHRNALKLLQLETDLQQAIANQAFCLHYQPIVDITAQQLLGFEALVRWQHPTKGMIAPDKFIPLAEETGLIIPLSEWILYTACQQMSLWCQQHPAARPLQVSVNIAAGLFQNEQFFGKLDQVLSDTKLSPCNLKLEVTESVLLKNIDAVLATLLKVKSRQIEISLDDFGTGYSSLSYLKQFPIDTLKIDKSFVDSLSHDGDSSLVEAIIQIANSLKMNTVAEGVETAMQRQWLQQLGCDAIQGYLIARPLPAHEIEAIIQASACSMCLTSFERG